MTQLARIPYSRGRTARMNPGPRAIVAVLLATSGCPAAGRMSHGGAGPRGQPDRPGRAISRPAGAGKGRQGNAERNDLVGVASLDANDTITHIHVMSLLGEHGIDGYVGGMTVVHGVYVPSASARRATQILREDAKRRRYPIVLAGERSLPYSYTEPDWHKTTLNLTYERLLQQPLYGQSSRFGQVLRDPHVKDAAKRFPVVRSIAFLPRQYLAAPGHLSTGYEVEIQLAANPRDGTGAHLSYQCWDAGRRVGFLGGR